MVKQICAPISDHPPLPTRGETYHALVLDARLWQSLSIVRSLGSRWLRLAALETVDNMPAPTFSSRWCQHQYVCPASEGMSEYLAYLEEVLDTTGAQVLMASSDGTIALIRRHRQRLEQRTHIALAQEPALGIAVSKERTLAIAEQLGLAVPHGVPLSGGNEVGAALHEIGLPAVVKPVESWVWGEQQGARFESQLVTTPDEARRAVEELTRCGGTVLFQQFLPGRRESLSFFYAHGEIYARYAYWGKRTDPPLGGLAVLRQSIAVPPDIDEQAERLIRAIGLEGYSQVEFRRDGNGKPYLMEINPRLNAGIELAVRAGVDFPYLLYRWANGERLDKVKGYQIGGQMRFLRGDIASTIASIQQRGRPGIMPPAQIIFDFCTSFFVPMTYDYVDWRDPLPVWTATAGFAHHLPQNLRKRLAYGKKYN